MFTTAPFLAHPDLTKPFVVKVDAFTSGVGAVLSQQHWDPATLLFQKALPGRDEL